MKRKKSLKNKIYAWFRDNGNKPAKLKEVEEAFPDVNPKSISGTLSRKGSNGDFDFARVGLRQIARGATEWKNGKWRVLYSLWVKDYMRLSSEKRLAEAETCSREEGEEVESISPETMLAAKFFSGSEAESSSIAKSLESIAKSLAQIAEAETSIAKLF